MSNVLLVEDESSFRETLVRALKRRGHKVSTARAGRPAIDLGSRTRPEVLILDWMLRNHLHGLQVLEALRLVDPEVRGILVTGYPSSDLAEEAERIGVSEILEKPFDLDALATAVESASQGSTVSSGVADVGVLDLRPHHSIAWANPRALELLARTAAGRDARHLDALFGPNDLQLLDWATEDWVAVHPRAATPLTWRVRARRWHDVSGSMLVILEEGQESRERDLRVRRLLGVDTPASFPLSFHGRFVVTDDEPGIRGAICGQLERAGAVAYPAESHGLAIRLLENDPGIRVLLLDYNHAGEDLGRTVARLRTSRPDLILVGMSGEDRRAEFADLGIKPFLRKPWSVAQLTDLLQDAALLP